MPARRSDRLGAYRAKRAAERTPEPFGGERVGPGHLFVVQQHAARRTHYDFRLEMHGVLWSWAVPKGPSSNPDDKRLAVHVEDHPLDYAEFEGRIPEGNYGAGAVILWDRGLWVPLTDADRGLAEGKLLFELRGHKLRGRWTLVRTRENWLLIKERDEWAGEEGTEGYPRDSVLSGLTLDELASGADRGEPVRAELRGLHAPERVVRARDVKVMLAVSRERPFSRAGWVFELKYDGYRMIAGKEGERVVLVSRKGRDITATFPEIARAVGALPFERLVLDGEVVVHDETGMPSFARLQKRGRLTRATAVARAAVELPATLYVIDLLGFESFDVRPLPLTQRKRILKDVLPTVGPLRYSEHVDEHGERLYEQICAMGLEGVVAKAAGARYRGGRSHDWVKIKAEKTDDFVVVGFTEPKGTRAGFGALHVAQFLGGRLRYAGRVGSGFTQRELDDVRAQLTRVAREDPPCEIPAEVDTGVVAHWVEPQLVCEVRFKERTEQGLLRAPVFLRFRDDKQPAECMREVVDSTEPAAVAEREAPRAVPFTNLDKVFWPSAGYTKGDLIAYYRGVAEWLLPYLRERPLVLTRYPDGIEGKSFFQKDAPDYVPEWIRLERIWSEDAQREVRYFVVEDAESLLYVVNLGTIPLHVWSSRVGSLERPDWCILDLDPKEAPFRHVVKTARAIRALCRDIALPSFVKTSGASGLHVLIPLGRQVTHAQSRTLAELLARVIVAELPDVTTVTRALRERHGRVYIDYVQNGHGRLLVAPFAVRPLPGAPVSMPLRWREVSGKLDPRRLTIANAAKRMRALKGDPLRALLELKPDLQAALEHLSERLNAAEDSPHRAQRKKHGGHRGKRRVKGQKRATQGAE